MIGRRVKEYCAGDFTQIENYDKAIADDKRIWCCHHRRETDDNKTPEELEEEGRYWNVPASELIFLTNEEHIKLHHKGVSKPKTAEHKEKLRQANLGKKQSKDTIAKRVAKLRGRKNSEHTLEKMRAAARNRVWTEEEKQRIRQRAKEHPISLGLKWFNNGTVNTRAKECPEGYVPGRCGDHSIFGHRTNARIKS